MKRHRFVTIVAIGGILAVSAGLAEAKSVSVHVGLSVGHRIARPIGAVACARPVAGRRGVAPPARMVVIRSPLRRIFAPIGHCCKTVVVHRPCVEAVVVEPAPVVTKTVVVEPAVVTVWIRNSNGSQSPVKLIRSGPGYIGPRGEYYPDMPNNEQLRMVYGF